eukprot:358615-Chlamydomonas_euryale.AAC.3
MDGRRAEVGGESRSGQEEASGLASKCWSERVSGQNVGASNSSGKATIKGGGKNGENRSACVGGCLKGWVDSFRKTAHKPLVSTAAAGFTSFTPSHLHTTLFCMRPPPRAPAPPFGSSHRAGRPVSEAPRAPAPP